MRLRLLAVTSLLMLAVPAARGQVVRESVTFTNVASGGTWAHPSAVVSHTFTGGYLFHGISVTSTLENAGSNHAPFCAVVFVSIRGGPNSQVLTPANLSGPYTTVAGSMASTYCPAIDPGGEWTFTFFDQCNLGSGPTTATWRTITIGLDEVQTRFVEDGDAPAVPSAATAFGVGQRSTCGPLDTISGTLAAGDVDCYLITASDTSIFTASTIGGAPFDTQLYLFDWTGFGIAFNDDAAANLPQSRIAAAFAPSCRHDGIFAIAIAPAGLYPVDQSGRRLWLAGAAPGATRAPDGPGAGSVIDHWEGVAGAGGAYTIAFTGATPDVRQNYCLCDLDDGSGTGTPDGGVTIDDLLFYLQLFSAGDIRADFDDGTMTGTPDCGVTVEDLLYFLIRLLYDC